jgi:hypothetical protein
LDDAHSPRCATGADNGHSVRRDRSALSRSPPPRVPRPPSRPSIRPDRGDSRDNGTPPAVRAVRAARTGRPWRGRRTALRVSHRRGIPSGLATRRAPRSALHRTSSDVPLATRARASARRIPPAPTRRAASHSHERRRRRIRSRAADSRDPRSVAPARSRTRPRPRGVVLGVSNPHRESNAFRNPRSCAPPGPFGWRDGSAPPR